MSEKSDGAVEAGGTWSIVKELSELPIRAIVGEDALAHMFSRCTVSIKRAVERHELPRPIRMFGKPCWTAGAILDHFDNRLQAAQLEAKKEEERIDNFSP